MLRMLAIVVLAAACGTPSTPTTSPTRPTAMPTSAPYQHRWGGLAIDVNYDITTYRFATPGTHRIEWRLGGLASNAITLEIH